MPIQRGGTPQLSTRDDPASRARRRAREQAQEREWREAASEPDFADALWLAHDRLGGWTRCSRQRCLRHRRCCGDVHRCGLEGFDKGWKWLHRVLREMRAGARPSAAMRAVDVAMRPKMHTFWIGWIGQKPEKVRWLVNED